MAAAEISQLRCESHGLMDIGNGNLCFYVCKADSFAKDRTPICRNPGYCPFKMKPDQKEVFLLLLGLPIKPLYLRLARTSPFRFSPEKGQTPGMVQSKLTTILSPNTQERHPPPILLSVISSVFPLLFLLLLPGYLRDQSEWKKRFQKPLAREPQIYFWRGSFFLSKQKSHREKQAILGCRGLFLIWPGLPPVLPRQRHNHSALRKKCGLDKGGEVFSLQNHSQNYGLTSLPLSLSNQANLLPIRRPSAYVPCFTVF